MLNKNLSSILTLHIESAGYTLLNRLIYISILISLQLCSSSLACIFPDTHVDSCADSKSDVDDFAKINKNATILTFQKVSGILPQNMLDGFEDLEEIAITFSNIDDIESNVFCLAPKLKAIHFLNTTLPKLKNGIFKNCTNLNKITFIFMPEFEIDEGAFTGAENVKTLLFDHGNWPKLKEGQLDGLKNLEYLLITNSKVETVDKTFFTPVKNLKKLSLVGNKITHLEEGLFDEMDALEDIQLFGNNLTAITGEEFSGLESLEVLDVINNPVTSIDVDGLLRNTPNLKHLYFTRSNIETETRKQVAQKLKAAGLSKLDF